MKWHTTWWHLCPKRWLLPVQWHHQPSQPLVQRGLQSTDNTPYVEIFLHFICCFKREGFLVNCYYIVHNSVDDHSATGKIKLRQTAFWHLATYFTGIWILLCSCSFLLLLTSCCCPRSHSNTVHADGIKPPDFRGRIFAKGMHTLLDNANYCWTQTY